MTALKGWKGAHVIVYTLQPNDKPSGKLVSADERGVVLAIRAEEDAPEGSELVGLKSVTNARVFVPWHNVAFVMGLTGPAKIE